MTLHLVREKKDFIKLMLEEQIDDAGERGWDLGNKSGGATTPIHCVRGETAFMDSHRCKWFDSVFLLRVRVVMRTSEAAGERN